MQVILQRFHHDRRMGEKALTLPESRKRELDYYLGYIVQ